MSKTTPGPWVAEKDPNTLIMQIVAPNAPRSRRLVARVGGADVREGNARLMAAGPDMLATLKEILDWEESCGVGGSYVSSLARAAIAKAEGSDAR